MPVFSSRTVVSAALVLCSTASPGAPESAPRTATKAEYLACLIDKATIDKRSRSLEQRDRALKDLDLKFQAAEADLAEQVRRKRPTSQKEIESYNRAVAARNKSAERFNEQGRSVQQDQRALNGFIFDTNARCGNLLVPAEVAAEAESDFNRLSLTK
jgi:hypothetical protein